ncbi:MAG: hypothetical protein SGJ10_08710 [Bacteroidota bacterium]|nr:hypothetical protein [Bacteroidota bacterium]
MLGELVYKDNIQHAAHTLDVNVSYLAKGIYFLRLGEETQRIVIE